VSGYLAPMAITVGVSFANQLYNTGKWDFKILVDGAIATGLLGLLSTGLPELATGIAWLAFTGLMLVNPTGGNSPVQNLIKITGKG
jgi:hypothetical protein